MTTPQGGTVQPGTSLKTASNAGSADGGMLSSSTWGSRGSSILETYWRVSDSVDEFELPDV